jgi:hypothetical protein
MAMAMAPETRARGDAMGRGDSAGAKRERPPESGDARRSPRAFGFWWGVSRREPQALGLLWAPQLSGVDIALGSA